ncbi:MAG TPA: dihydroxy-acid dehydratase, partial [Rhabdaerophilum sp.]|nr:dihydroxy-acid dehydratase [Rhabdaerophilum sp.]
MSAVHPVLLDVERRIVERSREGRAAYLDKLARMRRDMPPRRTLSCGNIAHVAAACGAVAKARIAGETGRNLAVVTAYNDMLSAHQPFETYPALIRSEAERLGHSAQVAGGVPAMCDGVTQGQPGMELSLFSRDVIAMAAAISLSHNAFDG